MKILTLEQRIKRLELLLESKADQERLKEFLGDEYYDKYNLIKNKISEPQYKDIYKLLKMNPKAVKNYIDSFQSKNVFKHNTKAEGAKLLYNDGGWKIYRITTYKAAQLYGANTKWCITGRYNGHEERGEEYFNDYIKDYNLDGGYYFYIKDAHTKYCLLKDVNGEIKSIWNVEDNEIDLHKITEVEPDFPVVDDIFNPYVDLSFDKDYLIEHIASCRFSDIKECVKLLIDDKFKFGIDDIFNDDNDTLLSWCIKNYKQIDYPDECIDFVASNSYISVHNNLAFKTAVSEYCYDALISLFNSGLYANSTIKTDEFIYSDERDYTLLQYVLNSDLNQQEIMNIVKLIIAHGGNVNKITKSNPVYPIETAVINDYTKIVKFLYSNGANIDNLEFIDYDDKDELYDNLYRAINIKK